jgi:hypothetical protein
MALWALGFVRASVRARTGGCGSGSSLTLKWDYENRTVDFSMPGYIENVLHKFQHKPPNRPQHAPYRARKPQYGSKVQLTPKFVNSPTLEAEGKKRIQQVIGTLLYYARAVYPTLVTSISSLASQ